MHKTPNGIVFCFLFFAFFSFLSAWEYNRKETLSSLAHRTNISMLQKCIYNHFAIWISVQTVPMWIKSERTANKMISTQHIFYGTFCCCCCCRFSFAIHRCIGRKTDWTRSKLDVNKEFQICNDKNGFDSKDLPFRRCSILLNFFDSLANKQRFCSFEW